MTFPASPTSGQQATEGGRLYQWNGVNAWELVANVTAHASSHAAAGSDPLTLSASQITGLGSLATASSVSYSSLTGTPSSFSPSSHASSHATGGADAITASIGAAATSHTHAASDIASGTLADARLSTNVILASALAARQQQTTSVLDAVDRVGCNNPAAMVSGAAYWTFFTPAYSLTISQISYISTSTTISPTLARFGLYTMDAAGNGTLVARTASDTTLFSTAAVFTRSLDTASGYPSTYTLQAGTRYAVAVCVVASTPGGLLSAQVNANLAALTPRVQGVRTGANDLPATQTSAQYNGSVAHCYWARLS